MAADQHGIPLFLQTFSGNEFNKKTLLTIITQLTKNLQHPGNVYHIADATFDTAERLTTLGTRTFWISRVPATLNNAKELIAAELVLHRESTSATGMRRICPIMRAFGRSGLCITRHQCRNSRRKRSRNGWRTTRRKQKRRCGTSGQGSLPASRMRESLPGSGLREHPLFCFRSLEIRTIIRKQE